MNIANIVEKKSSFPIIIAGPCSAESQEQVLSIAENLSQQHVDLFRCGIWKPRSSPNTFEGLGEKALPWLQEIKTKYGLLSCIEIGTPQHLEIALKYGIEHFWIGARTSVNPFLIQEIAEACRGCNIAIMVKNPIIADINLWHGNIERFHKVGISRLAAVFRGFSSPYAQPYRNEPGWIHLFEFMRLHRNIPIIFDPSHISGQATFVFELAQKAIYLNIQGLMIEVHSCPQNALSDKDQQLTPQQLHVLLENISLPNLNDKQDNAMMSYRLSIDDIDNEIITLLRKRNEIVGEIAQYKKKYKIPIFQPERWQKIIQDVRYKAEQQNLNPELVEQIFQLIHEESVKIQQQSIIQSVPRQE